eukprot:3319431-Rhodomonas_salina.3
MLLDDTHAVTCAPVKPILAVGLMPKELLDSETITTRPTEAATFPFPAYNTAASNETIPDCETTCSELVITRLVLDDAPRVTRASNDEVEVQSERSQAVPPMRNVTDACIRLLGTITPSTFESRAMFSRDAIRLASTS